MGILALPPSGIITDNDGIVIGRSSDGKGYLLTGGTEGQVPVIQGDGTIAYGAAGASSLSELDDWAANTLTVPGALTVRQAGGVAGTDEIHIYHDGTDAYFDNQTEGGWSYLTPRSAYGACVRSQITSSTLSFGYAQLEVLKGGASTSSIIRTQHAQGSLYTIAQGYASGDYDQGYAAYLHHSTFGSGALNIASDTTVNILAGGAGNEFITATVDTQGLSVRQPGGVAGTDEVQIYHDGTDAHIIPQSGNLDLNGYAVGTHNTDGLAFYRSDGADDFHFASTYSAGSRGFHIQGTGAVTIGNKGGVSWYDFEMRGGGLYLNSNNKYIQILSGYLAWDTAKTLLISEGDGRNGHSNGQGRIAITTTVDSPSFLAELTMSGYNSMNLSVAVEGTLIARQAGGVAGTDEVQIYHDGTNGNVVSQSGDLYLSSLGSSGPKITASGELSNNQGLTNFQVLGENVTVANHGGVAIGNNSICDGIGDGVAIGRYAKSRNWSSVAIGPFANALGEKAIAIGTSNFSSVQQALASGQWSIAIGNSSTAAASKAVAIGLLATSAYSSITLSGVTTAHSQFVVGGTYLGVTDVYIGNGVTNAAPADVTYNATGGSGTDISGANLILAGGRPTGAGTPGQVQFQVAPAGASGTTLGTLTTVGLFDEQGLTVRQPGGVAGTDEVQIYHNGTDGYIVSQSGRLRTTGTLHISDTPQIYLAGNVFEPATINFRNYSAIKAKSGFGAHSDFSILFEAPVNTTVMIVDRTSRVGIGIGATKPDYLFELGGEFALNELSADPSDPDEGKSVLWQSDGTGSGDDGDIMIKITAGGVTKTATLIDFSTV